jgi:hypothetical protein
LSLQVAELNLHLVELLKNATKEILAGGQIIRDLRASIHYNNIYISDGALGQEFLGFFRNSLREDQLAWA